MKTFFSESDKLYKVNLHSHTTESDGKLTPQQLKDVYKANGYSAVAITDHEFMVDHTELNDEEFIILPGYEYAINNGGPWSHRIASCHMNLFPKKAGNYKMVCYSHDNLWLESQFALEPKFQYVGDHDYKKAHTIACFNEIIQTANENDMFVMLNHPTWSLLSPETVKGFEGLWGIEIYNTGSAKSGLEEYEAIYYDMLLKQGKRLFCTATDDCHRATPPGDPYSVCCCGYVMVKAKELSHAALIDALLKGDFYSSTGAEIKALSVTGNEVHLKCSPCRTLRLRTKYRRGEVRYAKEGEWLTEAVFSVCPDDEYIRIELENPQGKRAFTNAIFTDELFR